MVKVIYNGDISPCRIRAGGFLFDKWEKNEVRDVPEEALDALLANEFFSEVKKEVKKVKKQEIEEEEVEEVSFDSDD